MKRYYTFLLLFFFSSTASVVVNKYVLWLLHFTYPTVFQSVQMFIISFLMFSLHVTGYINIGFVQFRELLAWCPAILFFTISIYFGSKALAVLPIPLLVLLQQVFTHTCLHCLKLFKEPVFPSVFVTIFLATSWLCVVLIFLYDVSLYTCQFLIFHCIANALYSYYALYAKKVEINEITKMFTNAFCSIVVLTLFGVKTGETWTVVDFEHINNIKFHIACLLSGVTGTLSFISYSKLCEYVTAEEVRVYHTLSMVFASAISFFIYQPLVQNVGDIATVVGLSSMTIQCCVLYTITYVPWCIKPRNDDGDNVDKMIKV